MMVAMMMLVAVVEVMGPGTNREVFRIPVIAVATNAGLTSWMRWWWKNRDVTGRDQTKGQSCFLQGSRKLCHESMMSQWELLVMTGNNDQNFFSGFLVWRCFVPLDKTKPPSVQDQLWAWWATMFVGITHLLPRLLSLQTPGLSFQSSHTLPCSGAALLHQGSSGMWPWL